jgi:hypothetical protein
MIQNNKYDVMCIYMGDIYIIKYDQHVGTGQTLMSIESPRMDC